LKKAFPPAFAVDIRARSKGISMRALLAGLIGDRKASTAIEYGLIAALIASVMIAALTTLGHNLNSQLIAIGTSLN
jgi:pilus assembly protein Flp/PilA